MPASWRPSIAAGEAEALIAKGWALADDDLAAQARLLTAEAFNGDDTDPATVDLVERALTLARRVGDPLIESAALDQLTAMQLARGEVRAAAASAMRRTEILAPMPVTATTGLEFFDSLLDGRRVQAWPPATCRRHDGWPKLSETCRSVGRRATWRPHGCSWWRCWPVTGPRPSAWPSGSARVGSGPDVLRWAI